MKQRDCPNCKGLTCGREADGWPCLICNGVGTIKILKITIEQLHDRMVETLGSDMTHYGPSPAAREAGLITVIELLTCNGDARYIRWVRRLKHPDSFRVAFWNSTHAWTPKRGDVLNVIYRHPIEEASNG